MRPKHNRGIRPAIILSLVSLAIPAVAAAQPILLSTPTASFSPTTLAVLATSSDVLDARQDWQERRSHWLARGDGAARARRIGDVAAQPKPTVAPQAPVVSPVRRSGGADWYAIAACESGGRWNLNTGNGFWGGLQFWPSTWFAYGGGPFDGVGPFPYSASQQIAVGERVLAGQGPGAWPNCFQWA
jgi:hypothetical protein